MIFPFNAGDSQFGPDDRCFVPEGQKCTSCDKEISQHEKSIHFGWGADSDLWFHVKCAEHVALMMMRDVAECRCGREVADARYKLVRKIVPYPR